MTAVTSIVLRIPRTDQSGEASSFVIVRVEQRVHDRLDLELSGTDEEQVFVGSIKHTSTSQLQHRTYKGSQPDWHTILFALLLQDDNAVGSEACRDVEIVATVKDNMSLSIRRKIDGITQRLGEIILSPNEDTLLSLFDWSGEAASRAQSLQNTSRELRLQLDEQEQSVSQLRQQLDQLKAERQDHEQHLLEKFAAIHNIQKLKSRDQARILSKHDIKVDAKKDVNGGSGSGKHVNGKRKTEPESDTELAGEQGDGTMSDATQRTETPDLESEAEEQKDAMSTPDVKDEVKPSRPAGSSRISRAQTSNQSAAAPRKAAIPPRRDLPFSDRASGASAVNNQDTAANDLKMVDDDDETDDEL